MATAGDDESFIPILADFLAARLGDAPEGSYSHEIMTNSVLARRKIMEEAFEVCLELGASEIDGQRLAEETADLVFHLLCALTGAEVAWSEVEQVLLARHQTETR